MNHKSKSIIFILLGVLLLWGYTFVNESKLSNDNSRKFLEFDYRTFDKKNPYKAVYLLNKHKSKTIFGEVQEYYTYLGDGIKKKGKIYKYSIKPKNEKYISVTGWSNPTGPDTKYEHVIKSSSFK